MNQDQGTLPKESSNAAIRALIARRRLRESGAIAESPPLESVKVAEEVKTDPAHPVEDDGAGVGQTISDPSQLQFVLVDPSEPSEAQRDDSAHSPSSRSESQSSLDNPEESTAPSLIASAAMNQEPTSRSPQVNADAPSSEGEDSSSSSARPLPAPDDEMPENANNDNSNLAFDAYSSPVAPDNLCSALTFTLFAFCWAIALTIPSVRFLVEPNQRDCDYPLPLWLIVHTTFIWVFAVACLLNFVRVKMFAIRFLALY